MTFFSALNTIRRCTVKPPLTYTLNGGLSFLGTNYRLSTNQTLYNKRNFSNKYVRYLDVSLFTVHHSDVAAIIDRQAIVIKFIRVIIYYLWHYNLLYFYTYRVPPRAVHDVVVDTERWLQSVGCTVFAIRWRTGDGYNIIVSRSTARRRPAGWFARPVGACIISNERCCGTRRTVEKSETDLYIVYDWLYYLRR